MARPSPPPALLFQPTNLEKNYHMSKEKITTVIATLLAFAAIAMAGYLFEESQKKDLQIKSLEGKAQQTQAAMLKSEETLAASEKTISEFKADLEKITAEKKDAEDKIKAFALQAAACEALHGTTKKHSK